MGSASFSKYSMFDQCPQKYKLYHVDGLGKFVDNIHTLFGTSMHETLQHFLEVVYNSDEITMPLDDMSKYLYERMVFNFKNAQSKLNEPPCTKEEMEEFYNDGVACLEWFLHPVNNVLLYPKAGVELRAIEYPIKLEILNNVTVRGFIDVILYDKDKNIITVIDIKTSGGGWNEYDYKSSKPHQLLLYKRWLSRQVGIPEKNIAVEFQIIKRKVWDDVIVPRIDTYRPPDLKPDIDNAEELFNKYITNAFNPDGSHNMDFDYKKKPSKLCDWCEFYRVYCDGK